MPRKRARFIIRAQIGFHTPLGKKKKTNKQTNKTKQIEKKYKNKNRMFS